MTNIPYSKAVECFEKAGYVELESTGGTNHCKIMEWQSVKPGVVRSNIYVGVYKGDNREADKVISSVTIKGKSGLCTDVEVADFLNTLENPLEANRVYSYEALANRLTLMGYVDVESYTGRQGYIHIVEWMYKKKEAVRPNLQITVSEGNTKSEDVVKGISVGMSNLTSGEVEDFFAELGGTPMPTPTPVKPELLVIPEKPEIVLPTGYKVRDRKTKLFSTGGHSPSWSKKGKIWWTKGALSLHLNYVIKQINADWEVISLRTDVEEVIPVQKWIEPALKRREERLMQQAIRQEAMNKQRLQEEIAEAETRLEELKIQASQSKVKPSTKKGFLAGIY